MGVLLRLAMLCYVSWDGGWRNATPEESGRNGQSAKNVTVGGWGLLVLGLASYDLLELVVLRMQASLAAHVDQQV